MTENLSDNSTIGYQGHFQIEDSIQFDISQYQWIDEYTGLLTLRNELPFDIGNLIEKKELLSTEPFLGRGSFATVYQATNLITNKPCAVKVMLNQYITMVPQIVQEYKVQSHLNKVSPSKFLKITLPVFVQQSEVHLIQWQKWSWQNLIQRNSSHQQN